MKQTPTLQIGDGWWNKYIKNTGPVESPTYHCAPHWQCTLCEFNHKDIITTRFHVQKEHKDKKTRYKIEMLDVLEGVV